MTIHIWVIILFILLFAAIAFGCLIVMTRMSLHLESEQEKSRALVTENKELTRALAHRNALDNIKTANDYYRQKEANNV